jgi:predicted metal-dependent hydrolase
MKNSPDWLPPVTLRQSERSRRIAVRISARNGLELIIPKRMSRKKAFEFLAEKLEWVRKHLHLLQVQPPALMIPQTINLLGVNEEWEIHYTDRQKIKLKENKATCGLYFRNDLQETDVQRLLKSWLIKKAKRHLPELIKHHSQTCNLPFNSLSIRLQRSRWGSCTRDKNISLNSRLLLLPPELTRYIIIHELTHTIHFDHSAKFWNHVALFVPNHLALRSDLKKIEQDLPNWLY